MTTYDEYGMPVGAHSEPESFTHQAWRRARAFVGYRLGPKWRDIAEARWHWKRLFTLVNVLVVLWIYTLYWGERSAFKSAVESCDWKTWEDWPQNANPHRLVFIADPQLVDPHTYPGRPWPLSTLTVAFADQYIRRSYSRIQQTLYPDTVMFLGDLFDGGREWATQTSNHQTSRSPEKQYWKYGDTFWQREYARFGDIFFKHWSDGGMDPRPGQPGRKVIASLPGNHDLGFGKGVQMAVRKRFVAYFGDGNRVDIVGNHTFVSLDTVSLSARDQNEPGEKKIEAIWKPAAAFLDNVQEQKPRLEAEELRVQQGFKRTLPFRHEVVESTDLAKAELPKLDGLNESFPTILLSHVPLYRAPGTPCGPLREHWPPTPPPKGQSEPLQDDERNAIAVRGGYQYQNVLSKDLSKHIAEKIGNVAYAFSGDDHDYCEVVHRGYASAGGGIREITVKSISLAMGVRKPGVQMVSLWNPVDGEGRPVGKGGEKTLQTRLCLLPDQLGALIRYVLLIVLTLGVLAVRAALVATGRIAVEEKDEKPLLPTTRDQPFSSAESEKAGLSSYGYPQEPYHETTSSNSSSTSERSGYLQVRNQTQRARSTSPKNGYALPSTPGDDLPGVKIYGAKKAGGRGKKRDFGLFVSEFRDGVFRVAGVGLVWFAVLNWMG